MPSSTPPVWKIKHLIITHLFVIFLIVSVFYTPLYNFLWKFVDAKCFHAMTALIAKSAFWQNFWALANHRIGDAIEDVFFVIFFVWLIKITPRGQKLQKSAEFFFLALLTASVVLLINNFLFKQLIHIVRHSPSIELGGAPQLAHFVSWIKVKGGSQASFPSDHSTTALLFVCTFLYLSRNTLLSLCVCLYGAFLCSPRLISGAHWLTDILCGSSSVVLVVFSWVFYTPFASFCIKTTHKIFVKTATVFSRQFPKETL
jgi:membrane-associated phospholipid phosphatase